MTTNLHDAVRTNFAEKAAYVAHRIPTMSVTEADTFVAIDCGLPSDTLNVIVARTLLATDHVLQDGVGHFMAKQFPMALWYWETAGDRHGMGALTAYGLAHTETHIAMYADRTHVRAQVPLPAGLAIRAATQPDEIRSYGAVIAALFGDSDEGRQVAAYHTLLSEQAAHHIPALRLYIGTYDDRVVAIGSFFIGSETVGIYDIVTRDDYRHKGIGTAMFAHVLTEARHVERHYAVLQASPDGLRVYEKAGFTAVGTVHTFENRRLL